jgi:4-hydroxy-tetrahydrodipicolinate reductase
MKIAVLGIGKTGSKVVELLTEKHIDHVIFNSKNPPTMESLKNCDVAISFLPSDPFNEYINLLLESKIPLVTGTTGFTYSEELKKKLIDQKVKWIYGNNFSLGMNIVRQMIYALSKAQKLIDNPDFKIHEIHHTKKLDAPSGTAISWKNWITEKENNIVSSVSSERTGDVIGFHEITMTSKTEVIRLSHEALDRKIFAEGAVFMALKLLKNNSIPVGLSLFQDIIEKEISL